MLRQLGRLSFNLSDYYFFGHPIEKSHICLMTSQVEHRSGVRASPTGQKWTFLGHLRSDSNEIKFAVIGSFPSITAPIVMAIGCETTERPQGTSADINNLPFRGRMAISQPFDGPSQRDKDCFDRLIFCDLSLCRFPLQLIRKPWNGGRTCPLI